MYNSEQIFNCVDNLVADVATIECAECVANVLYLFGSDPSACNIACAAGEDAQSAECKEYIASAMKYTCS